MKKYFVTVNGNRYEVEIEEDDETVAAVKSSETAPKTEPAPAPVHTPAPAVKKAVSKAEGEELLCPMPGTILRIDVKEGDSFKKGDVLFVLEAMKMENEIRAAKDGEVIQIATQKGSSVNANELLAIIK